MPSILVVDDDTAIQNLLRAVLTSDGFDVRCVGDGQQALHALEAALPDLMILDLEMPVMNGRAVLRELKLRSHDLAVLILSAYGARAAGREFALPAMEKPFDIDELSSEAARLTTQRGSEPSDAH